MNLRALVLGVLIGCISACSNQNEQSSDAVAVDALVIDDELYFSFIERASEIATEQGYEHNAVAKGAFIAAQAPFEYWQWIAVLFDAQGRAYALQQRFLRSRLSTRAATIDSKWQFSEVLASDYQFSIQDEETPETHAQAQRVALDLAGTDSSRQAIWVGAYGVAIHDSTDNTSDDIDGAQHCIRTYELNLPNISAEFRATVCPEIDNTRLFSVSSGAAMPVVATYQVDRKVVNLSGHGWFIHGWGVPPVINDSPVLVDQAWLVLDQQQDLQLQRTRRRSGRGQSLATGSQRLIGSVNEVAEIDLQWRDDSELQLGAQNGEPPMDLTLIPLGPSTPSLIAVAQPRLKAVLVQGVQSGAGFVDIRRQLNN